MKAKVKDFYEHIMKLEGLGYIENYLKYQLAPVIKGVKPSLTLNITHRKQLIEQWDKYGKYVLKDLNLKYVVLRKTSKGKILLIYDPQLVQQVLSQKQVREFLINIGYTCLETEKAISYLVKRYEKYHCPHELGIFLGIPLQDVKDFINCSPRECMFCGYWKVYNNLDSALKTFRVYDLAKEMMLNQLIEEFQIVI